MTFLRRPNGAGTVVLSAAVLTLASIGAGSTAVKIYQTVNCAVRVACQTYSNSNGTGVIARSTNAAPADQFHEIGLQAFGNGGNALYASSSRRNAGYFDGRNTGYYSLFATNDVSGGYMFGASNSADGGTLSLDSFGNLAISGQLTTGADVRVRHQIAADRAVSGFGVESASRAIEDVGIGRLVNGRAGVRLDPTFAGTIDAGYFVFVTPLGENRGLYVASQNRGGFEVRESLGARSTLAFNYRIVGHPAGTSRERLPTASDLIRLAGGRAR